MLVALAANRLHAADTPPEFVAWPPVTDEERQVKGATVEKDAGAEILYWRVHVLDVFSGSEIQRNFYHYVRMKVFDDRGKEKASTIDLEAGPRAAILNVAGRTIKADGTVVELQKSAVYQRDVVRVSGVKRKVTSFAMPAVEPGAILEYRWVERLDSNAIMYLRLQFQREFPVRKVTYYVRPLPGQFTAYQMFMKPFNCTPSALQLERDGSSSTSIENIPAFHEEPFAPSEPNLRPWALLYYTQEVPKNADKFWEDTGKKAYQELKDSLKTNDEMKAAAQQAIAGANTDEEKVAALIRYIQKNIRRVSDEDVTEAERVRFYERLPKDRRRTSVEVFKSGIGMSDELNMVFAALAVPAGLDARPAYVADQNEILFNPKTMVNRYFIDNLDTAVKIGDGWKVYDPANRLLTPGMLPPAEEGMFALISDPKKPSFLQVPFSAPAASAETRTAKLQLGEDGSLEGDAEEAFTGHRAFDRRFELRGESKERREEWLKDRLTKMFPDSEISAIAIENVDDASQPLKFRYHLKAPQFAQATGRRMFFHILPFERAIASPFSASDRRYPVAFPYAWEEKDQVMIQLPKGSKLDNAENPGSITFGVAGQYDLKMTITPGGLLTVTRDLTFGKDGALFFEAKQYSVVKQVFAEIQKRNTFTLALREAQ